ncbi:CaiB/BaiF CoA transferase family protein [Rhodoplanes azumiensis]|uniref:CaiB/BaiF CoA transferase family protein n=1 Tax=Rhodoplanes azumiensis TaxID=1897628 RepID=A0ABW5AI99_9BRAD
MTKSPSSALAGLRILDLTRVRAGPTCCRVFADFGADVIKIEAPAGVDPNEGTNGARSGADMQNLHRNKRSVTLNLKTAKGLALFKRMVETADVVVENYRPDVKIRLGIAYEDLKAVNPRIILASISGFGQDGPYRHRPGFDQIAQGMGGLMGVTGLPGQGPVRAGIAVADSSAGLYAAIGILVALAERARSGEGQWVCCSLLQAQIAMMDFQAAKYLVEGTVPKQAGNDHPYTTPMGVMRTADGWINIGVGGQGQWRAFCDAIGEPALATHPDYDCQESRLRNRDALKERLAAVFARKTSHDWLTLLEEANVPAGPIYAMDEVFADPQVQHLGIAVPVEDPERGTLRLVGQPVALSRTPAALTTLLPAAGAHNDQILSELGLGPDEIETLRKERVI